MLTWGPRVGSWWRLGRALLIAGSSDVRLGRGERLEFVGRPALTFGVAALRTLEVLLALPTLVPIDTVRPPVLHLAVAVVWGQRRHVRGECGIHCVKQSGLGVGGKVCVRGRVELLPQDPCSNLRLRAAKRRLVMARLLARHLPALMCVLTLPPVSPDGSDSGARLIRRVVMVAVVVVCVGGRSGQCPDALSAASWLSLSPSLNLSPRARTLSLVT